MFQLSRQTFDSYAKLKESKIGIFAQMSLGLIYHFEWTILCT